MKIVAGLPPEAHKDELISMDMEMFGQTKGKLHRPTGSFACISVCLERDKNTVYQIYDEHDIHKLVNLSKKGLWIFHNALYDLRQMKRYASIKPRFIWDTMLADQAMQGGYYPTFRLGDLSRRWLALPMEKDTREDFYDVREMTPQMKKYAALDAQRTLLIAQKQREEYLDDPAFRAYLVADEPMIFPVLNMPGIRVDVGAWTKAVEEFQRKADKLEEELGINVKSVPQTKSLAAKHGVHLKSTGQEILKMFKDKPVIAKIIEARMYRDAVSKYGMKWLEEHVEGDGMVYSDYKITGADQTGRMAAASPNMQNIPVRKLPVYRTFFVPVDGNVMEIADVSQQEPCIEAFESKDRLLLEIVQSGESTHLMVAREIFGDSTIEKGSELYDIGKTINLGTAYGLSEYGLSTRINTTPEEARKFLDKYFSRFGGVASWIIQMRQKGLSLGYVTTNLGRRSHLNIHDYKWKNQAINAPIQGGAADFTKVWARKIWEKSDEYGVPFTTVEYVHDEIVRDTPKEYRKQSKKLLSDTFVETGELLYPGITFRFGYEYGKSWGAKQISEEALEEDE